MNGYFEVKRKFGITQDVNGGSTWAFSNSHMWELNRFQLQKSLSKVWQEMPTIEKIAEIPTIQNSDSY